MDKEGELRRVLVEEVRHIRDCRSYPDLGRAFQHWSATNILGIEDKDVNNELEGAMGADGGIDYFHVDKDKKTVEIIQAKFSEDESGKVEPKAVLDFYGIPRKLLFNTSDRSLRFRKQQELYKKLVAQKYATRLLFLTTARLPESAKRAPFLEDPNTFGDITFEFIETKDLIAYVGNPKSPPCELRLNKDECFIGMPDGTQLKRMVATVPALELKRVCESIGVPTLFSLNPRLSLGSKSTISKKIKETVESTPERLWHYNNGISAVCKRFEYDKSAGIVHIDNLKVVNGCQTITTIDRMDEVDPRAGLVIRLSETNDGEFGENISKCTNDQSVIKSPDLQSDHPYLKNLEKRFNEYDKFFFERKRGQWLSNVERPKTRQGLYLIKSVDAARLKLAYTGSPHSSMQLSAAALFRPNITNPAEPNPFSRVYKDADPRDFIIPSVFDYLLAGIKKRIRINDAADTEDVKNTRFLLKYRIGQYYVIGMVGRILDSMDTNTKNAIVDAIIDKAINYDTNVMENIAEVLTDLVTWIASEITEVIGDHGGSPLHNQEMYYLRDPLRKGNRLQSLYQRRESLHKYTKGQDLFGTALCEILGVRRE